MALLRNEFPKQRRFTPVRGLLSRVGDSILSLKPCFMMSPLSLAKFAKPGHLEFNIVVVDEASQMKPEEALGALLRTKQVVVNRGAAATSKIRSRNKGCSDHAIVKPRKFATQLPWR
jgi:superfamily I DNA and/or RNA helicase